MSEPSSEKKNICLTITSLAAGGAEKQCLLLARALKHHHRVYLVVINQEPQYHAYLEVIENEQINQSFLSKNLLKRIPEFTRFLKRKQIDFIFSFLPNDTVTAAVCGKMAGVPHLFGGIRNSYVPWFKFIALKAVNNFLLSFTIANNYAAYRSAMHRGFKKNVMVIPNGIEIRKMSPRKKRKGHTINIISLGRLVAQKDYITAIKSISYLKKMLPGEHNIIYRIVGSGPERKFIVKHIEKEDLKSEITLIENPPDIYELLGSSDIYLCTSSFEGISNAIMEAMNCALPIVATDAGDNSQLVIHKKNGLLSKIGDYNQLAHHLYELVESPEIREQMGLESYYHLQHSYSYEHFRETYLSLIENTERIQIQNGNLSLSID